MSDLTVSAGGLDVRVRPLGFRLLAELPERLQRIADSGADSAELLALADVLDRYALDEFPKPSDVPPDALGDLVRAWVAGVRDAAVPPPTAAG